jgi:hypothetical protein
MDTARVVKRLDATARAPVLSALTEVLGGLPTIRASRARGAAARGAAAAAPAACDLTLLCRARL